MDIDRDMLLQVFATQSEENLSTMEEALIALEDDPADGQHLHAIFRICHTLKGDSATLGLPQLTEFAHELEDLLERLRAGTTSVTRELITLLLQAVDVLREMVADALKGKHTKRRKHQALLRRFKQDVEAKPKKSKRSEAPGPQDPAEPPQPEAIEELEQGRSATRSSTLRVRLDTLDRLLNLTGEIAVARSHLTQMFEAMAGADSNELLEAHHAIDPLFADLQQEVMKVRMVQVGPLFRQHYRTVRDLALANGKSARLEIEGGEAELDTTVIEHLRDPLTQMIRNSMAHGIEFPEEREACGKDSCGRISLRAFHDGGSIVVQVADDGRGLNRAGIRQRARERGLAAEPEKLSEQQLDRLVFEAGFSTAESTTLSSGRGVGMDVVRRNIEALHGSVRIDSVEGEGTTVTIRLPLTLAIIDGFNVGIDDENYVLPLTSVVECMDLPVDEDRGTRGYGVINLRGCTLPYVGLRQLLGIRTPAPARESIVVVSSGGERAGISVDVLHGESQTVIKPLGRLFRDTAAVAGSTILGDGRVALILDVSELLRAAAELEPRGIGESTSPLGVGDRGPLSQAPPSSA
jgi:two-component system chemotaxis sensor kinase CheA